jgi:hypothetical protein
MGHDNDAAQRGLSSHSTLSLWVAALLIAAAGIAWGASEYFSDKSAAIPAPVRSAQGAVVAVPTPALVVPPVAPLVKLEPMNSPPVAVRGNSRSVESTNAVHAKRTVAAKPAIDSAKKLEPMVPLAPAMEMVPAPAESAPTATPAAAEPIASAAPALIVAPAQAAPQ